jgi:hypothetical protein
MDTMDNTQPITSARREAIRLKLASIDLVTGKGSDRDHACTISAINIALGNGQVDSCDPCMSRVVHAWVIRVQDAMPAALRAVGDEHGDRWRSTAPLIAGSATTGPSDAERLQILLDWMWDCLSHDWQTWVPAAAHDAWAVMLIERTTAHANTAHANTAAAAGAAADAADAAATRAANTAADAAFAAATAAYAAATAADAAIYANNAAAGAIYAATAAGAAIYANNAAAAESFWRAANPAKVLAQLVGTNP